MKFYKIILFALIAVGLSSCVQKQKKTEDQNNIKFYRHIQFSETPWDIEKGTHEISAEEAQSVNNYKFTYIDNSQLVSVEYNRNDVLLDYSSVGAAKITYTYEGNKQVKLFFDSKNEPSKNGGAAVYEYTINDVGMRVALRFLDENGEPIENRNNIHKYKWKKLDDGKLQEVRFNLAGEDMIMNPFCPFYELRFSYGENGFLTQMANYEEDTLYNCTAENCGDIGVSYFLFKNSKHGDIESFSVHNTVGQLSNLYWGWAKKVTVFDDKGYAIETTQFDQDDEFLGGKNLPITKSVYDEHGALVKRISMDKNKNIENNPANGVAIIEYKYDKKGHRIETLRYDKDNVLVDKKS